MIDENKPVGEVLPKWGGGHQVRLTGPVRVGDKLYNSSDREAELAARVAELEHDCAMHMRISKQAIDDVVELKAKLLDAESSPLSEEVLDILRSENRSLKTNISELEAELAALKRQEPVAIAGVYEKECGQFDFTVTPHGMQILDSGLTNLYSAAGAREVPYGYQLVNTDPSDDDLADGVRAMRLFVTKNSLADFRTGYKAMLQASKEPA